MSRIPHRSRSRASSGPRALLCGFAVGRSAAADAAETRAMVLLEDDRCSAGMGLHQALPRERSSDSRSAYLLPYLFTCPQRISAPSAAAALGTMKNPAVPVYRHTTCGPVALTDF